MKKPRASAAEPRTLGAASALGLLQAELHAVGEAAWETEEVGAVPTRVLTVGEAEGEVMDKSHFVDDRGEGRCWHGQDRGDGPPGWSPRAAAFHQEICPRDEEEQTPKHVQHELWMIPTIEEYWWDPAVVGAA